MRAMPSLSYSRTGNTAQIHGNDWGSGPEVWALDHQVLRLRVDSNPGHLTTVVRRDTTDLTYFLYI